MAIDSPNQVRRAREACGLSQVELAQRTSLSRQSIGAIETGRSIPSVDVALRIARALSRSAEELFGNERGPTRLIAELIEPAGKSRVCVARIHQRWVARPLLGDHVGYQADAVIVDPLVTQATLLQALRTDEELEDNVIVVGCALGLGIASSHLNCLGGPGSFRWFGGSNEKALRALAQGHCHIAGVHSRVRARQRSGRANRRSEQSLVSFALGRWEAGLVMRVQDASRIRDIAALEDRSVRLVGREAGSGAHTLLREELAGANLPSELADKWFVLALGHLDVARCIAEGRCDVGIATRDAASAFGLHFVPLAEEFYDLTFSSALLADPRVNRLLDGITTKAIRTQLEAIGYNMQDAGCRVEEAAA